jgi:AAA domain (dynein-related subfamily)
VFLWETGPQAGVLAAGRIVSEPALIEQGEGEERFERVPDKFSGSRVRVHINIEHVLRPRLSRQQVSADEVLASLPNLKFANATSFKLAPSQAAVLDELVRQVEAEPWAAPGLLPEDFEVLAMHQTAQPWDELSDVVRAAYGRLRDKLDLYAALLADGLGRNVKLKPFVSHGNPMGRNPLYQWCCVYPESVRNKSYGFQLAIIVKPDSVEYGFGAGEGRGGSSNEAKLIEFREEFQSTRSRLLSLRTDAAVLQAVANAQKAGLSFRSHWNRTPEDEPITSSFDAWVTHAASGDGGGAAFSAFATRDEVVAHGSGFLRWIAGQLERVLPIMERLYASRVRTPAPTMLPTDHRPLAQLANELSLDTSYLEDVDWLLRDRKQLIFYGPPGTGKTFVAETFAEWFAGSHERVETIQFHASYAYEDFVEGIRPNLDTKVLRYALVPGILQRFAEKAEGDPRPCR